MYYARAIILLAIVYLMLTANLQPSNIVVGLLVGTGVVLVLRPKPGPVDLRRTPAAAVALARYVLVLVYDLLWSGIQVARIVLSRRMPLQPGITAIPSECETELGSALSAHAITLTPGEMVLEMDELGIMYTHCLDATEAKDDIIRAQKMRRDLLDKIFE